MSTRCSGHSPATVADADPRAARQQSGAERATATRFTTDQRALTTRVNGAAADMGAVEMPTVPITVKTVIVGTPPGSGLFVLSVTGANATGGSNPQSGQQQR